jgi:very-short-patch-repair endonuclease
MKNKDLNHELVERATTMRKQQTPEEGKLWHLYLKKLEPRFKRQVVIGPYIVDFYCSKLKLIIEIDGEQHFFEENLEYEKRREEFLQGEGFALLRFYNSDINKKISDTETTIYHRCIDRAKELGIDVPIVLKERG